MGINKKDVKLIIHLFLPHTVEEYFQQAEEQEEMVKKHMQFYLRMKVTL